MHLFPQELFLVPSGTGSLRNRFSRAGKHPQVHLFPQEHLVPSGMSSGSVFSRGGKNSFGSRFLNNSLEQVSFENNLIEIQCRSCTETETDMIPNPKPGLRIVANGPRVLLTSRLRKTSCGGDLGNLRCNKVACQKLKIMSFVVLQF